jgi:replicative DNA helicase
LLKALGNGVTSEASLADWIDRNASKKEELSLFFNPEFIKKYGGDFTDIFNEFKNKALIKYRDLKTASLVDEAIHRENLNRAIERSMRYRIHKRTEALTTASADLEIDIHTSSADCTHDIGNILSTSQQGAVISVEANAEALLEYITGTGAGRVLTPFPMLNDLTGGGFANGTKTALVSPPGGGKSTVSAQIADYAAGQGIPTIFVSMEMSQEQLFVNSLARAASINSSKIMSPYSTIKEAVINQVAEVAETYFKTAGKYLYIVEGGYNTTPARISTMVSKIRADLKMSRNDPFLVVIDYLQLLYTGIEAMDIGPNETQKISELAVRVKQLARDSNVAILALSDVTKEEQKNSNESKELTLNSLRGSNRIAHAADVVIALYSESAQADGGKAKKDPWAVYVKKVESSETAIDVIQSIQNAKQENPIGGEGAAVYARMELIKNRAGQGRGSQFLLYHRAYHKFVPITLGGQEKAEGRA